MVSGARATRVVVSASAPDLPDDVLCVRPHSLRQRVPPLLLRPTRNGPRVREHGPVLLRQPDERPVGGVGLRADLTGGERAPDAGEREDDVARVRPEIVEERLEVAHHRRGRDRLGERARAPRPAAGRPGARRRAAPSSPASRGRGSSVVGQGSGSRARTRFAASRRTGSRSAAGSATARHRPRPRSSARACASAPARVFRPESSSSRSTSACFCSRVVGRAETASTSRSLSGRSPPRTAEPKR